MIPYFGRLGKLQFRWIWMDHLTNSRQVFHRNRMQWLWCRSPRRTFRSHGRCPTTMVLTSISRGSWCLGGVLGKPSNFTLESFEINAKEYHIQLYLFAGIWSKCSHLAGWFKQLEQYNDFFSGVRRTTFFGAQKSIPTIPIIPSIPSIPSIPTPEAKMTLLALALCPM